MKYFSMFSGIGGFEYVIEKATGGKWECVGYSEIDKHAIAVYSHRFSGQRNYGDATRIDTGDLPEFDLLCGGFPCQAFSVAGKREGFGDTRGTLFFEIARILEAKRPPYCFLENVKGLLNHDGGKTFGVIIETLGSLGYDVQWFLLNSKFHGVPQNRERVFIVGSLRGTSKPQILPLGESAEEISGVPRKEGKIDYGVPNDKKDYRVVGEDGIAPSVQARSDTHKILDASRANEGIRVYDKVCPTLSSRDYKEPRVVMNTITQAFGRRGHSKEEMSMSKAIMESEIKSVAYRTRAYCGQDGQIEERKDDVANQLTTVTKDSMVMEKKPIPVNPDGIHPCIDANYWKGQSNQRRMIAEKTARCLDSNMWKGVTPEHYFDKCQRNVVMGESGRTPGVGYEGYSIRRLTPIECERLQGFPDGWTSVGNYDGTVKEVSDTQRYKMLGNAVTTNVIEAIVRSWVNNCV